MNPLLTAGRIGIVKLSSLGDVLLATPVATNLRKASPGAFIAWVTDHRFSEVLEGNPYVDEVVSLPPVAWPPWKRHARQGDDGESLLQWLTRLRRLRLETVIDIQGLLKGALVALASGARWRIGGSRDREGSRYLANVLVPQLPAEAGARDGYLRYLEHFDIPISDPRLVFALQQSDRLAGAWILDSLRSGTVIAMAPASGRHTKDWPLERYAGLADRLAKEVSAQILLIGSTKDQAAGAEVQAGMKAKALDLTGRTTLRQLAAVLERCSLLIGGDSGPLYLANAVRTPVLGLFGPTNGCALVSTLGKESVLWKPPTCAPCRDWDCRKGECMLAITVEEVLSRALWLLGGSTRCGKSAGSSQQAGEE